MGTRKKFNFQFQQLVQYKPRAVFINLGGNDISAGCTADKIVWDLVNITEALYEAGVEKVFVASIVHRGKFPPRTGLTQEEFNKCRKYINKKLKTIFGEDFIQVGKRLRYPLHYDSDLVHPGLEEGGLNIFRHYVQNVFKKLD